MSNPIYNAMAGNQSMMPGGFANIFQRFKQFQQMFRGDPRQQVQQLLNSGRVSQTQYNQAVQMAQTLQRMMGGK